MEILKDKGNPVPLLDYADFITVPFGGAATAISREGTIGVLFYNLLKPGWMPIHPAIYNRSELYTERFVDKIYQSIPESLNADISAASRVLEVDLGVVENNGAFNICYQGKKVCSISEEELGRDKFAVNSDDRWGKEVGYERSLSKLESGVTTEGKPHYTYIFSYPPEKMSAIDRRFYPLSRETIDAYKFKVIDPDRTAELIVWHTHNTDYLSRLLMIRSFAILFNNLGLEELGLV